MGGSLIRRIFNDEEEYFVWVRFGEIELDWIRSDQGGCGLEWICD